MPFSRKQWWRDYFSFTKKERIGVMVLLIIIVALFMLPSFFSKPKPPDAAAVKEFKEAVAKIKIPSGADERYRHYHDDDHPLSGSFDDKADKSEERPGGSLFYFDPNTATADEWKQLGVRDKTIATIQKYLSKGGSFKEPESLLKIYGLREADARRLVPYVRIAKKENAAYEKNNEQKPNVDYTKTAYNRQVDINLADTAGFIALPGIGSKLAHRIVSFREKLGGFYSVEQIAETYGLQDSVFQKIRARLTLSHGPVKRININTATIDELKNHPYIKWNLANVIVQYRVQHGDFQTLESLQRIAVITSGDYEKILPYIVIK